MLENSISQQIPKLSIIVLNEWDLLAQYIYLEVLDILKYEKKVLPFRKASSTLNLHCSHLLLMI